METRLLINGERIAGTGSTLEIVNPFSAEKVIDIPSASIEQVDAAVAAARQAFPGWMSTAPAERAAMLNHWQITWKRMVILISNWNA